MRIAPFQGMRLERANVRVAGAYAALVSCAFAA